MGARPPLLLSKLIAALRPSVDGASYQTLLQKHADLLAHRIAKHDFMKEMMELAGRAAVKSAMRAIQHQDALILAPQLLPPAPDDEMLVVQLVDESNCFHWRVELSPPPDSPLSQQLRQPWITQQLGGRPAVLLSVTFPPDFPQSPPFVRVVAPRLQFHTGHVTVGGSICMEALTSTGWKPDYSMEGVLMLVRQAMVDGGAKLDSIRAHVPYSEQEARAAFIRVARDHGWKV